MTREATATKVRALAPPGTIVLGGRAFRVGKMKMAAFRRVASDVREVSEARPDGPPTAEQLDAMVRVVMAALDPPSDKEFLLALDESDWDVGSAEVARGVILALEGTRPDNAREPTVGEAAGS